jgi:hypothetical protein
MDRISTFFRATLALSWVTVGVLGGAPAEVAGQGTRAVERPDFLFSQPKVSLTVRTGLQQFRAQGQFYDFVIREFSVEREDFRGAGLGVEFGFAASDRIELLFAMDGGGVQVSTESRDWEEADGSPIRQDTRVRVGPAAQAGVRLLLIPRGESLTQLAWAPNSIVPFVSGGAGYTAYSLRQWGDFVDAQAAEIFAADFVSSGGTALAFAGGGVDIKVGRSLYAVFEGRYQWSSAELAGDFARFEPLDLSGLRLTAGLSVRF